QPLDHRNMEDPERKRRLQDRQTVGGLAMRFGAARVGASAFASVLAALLLSAVTLTAHHEILAKFDDKKPVTLSGVVTLVDWRNPHVHLFMNVADSRNEPLNWAIELESPIDLQENGWNRDSLQPGDAITVKGIAARNGSRQAWANSVVVTATGRTVLNVSPS